MGMGDVSKGVTPKFALLAKPAQGGTIATRYFVPDACHKALAVTGTVCLASACAIPGHDRVADRERARRRLRASIEIEHPSGKIAIDLDADFTNGKQELRRAALIRTARRVFEGRVLVPEKVWAGPESRETSARRRSPEGSGLAAYEQRETSTVSLRTSLSRRDLHDVSVTSVRDR